MKKIPLRLYITALMLTLVIFSVAFYVSAYINNKKTQELKEAVDKIAIDILSFETQSEIIKESSCKEFDKTELRKELDSLASRLSFLEGQVGRDNPDVARLRHYYSLLQIRDYLLTKRMSEQCNFNTISILYFYADAEKCPTCQTQQYILRAIQDTYPEIEIYTFDYDLDVPAIETLINIHNIPKTPPIIDINGKLYAPFDSRESMEAVLEPLLNPVATSTTATSTNPKTR